jgi:hypothetical protein
VQNPELGSRPAWPLPKKVPQAELQHMVTILIHTTRDNDRFVAFVTVERAARMDQVRSTRQMRLTGRMRST